MLSRDDHFNDGKPNPDRINRRLKWLFPSYLLASFVVLCGHSFWALETGISENFARSGGVLVALSVVFFGLSQHFIAHELWRYQRQIERENMAASSYAGARAYLQWNMRVFNLVNVAIAALGTLIGTYGDLWFP